MVRLATLRTRGLTAVHLPALVEEAVARAEREAESLHKGLSVRCARMSDVADAALLGQALQEVLSNALEFSGHDVAPVAVALERRDTAWS